MKAFELKIWMTENRGPVINVYNETAKNEFFIGISLKDFMVKVYDMMVVNNPKSSKRATSLLSAVLGDISYNVSRPYTF